MRKILLLFVTALLIFTLSACSEDTSVQDSIDVLEGLVAENTADYTALSTSLTALQTELNALTTSVTALEGQSDAADVLITGIIADIVSVEAAITALQTDVATNTTGISNIEAAIATLNTAVADLQAQITALSAIVGLIVNPLPVILDVKVTEIVIAHVNDAHGRVNDDSYGGVMGMATVKNLIDALDKKYENVFLVAAGDMVHGTTFATLEEGESFINVMNQVGFDLMVPGNHDFNYGQDRLLELEDLADFPMISANIQYALDDSDFMNPYVIQDFDGVKVGFFGLTTPETTYKTHPDNVIGLNFLDPIAQATAMVAMLDPLVDIIILVAHIGLDESTLITSEDIATQVVGIDVIIDGHSHTSLSTGMMVGETLIVSAGEYMKNIGLFTLTVQNGEIIFTNAILISTAEAKTLNYGSDQDIQDYIDAIIDLQDVILSEVVGQTSVLLLGVRDNVRTGETNLGDLIADSMLEVSGADVAFTNGGGIRASIDIGLVTLGDIITVLPFGNIIHTKEVTGAVILAVLEHGTSSYPSSSGKFPHVAGMTFTINTNNPAGSRVENVMVNGVALDLVATYTMATNDFLAAGGDGYVMLIGIPTAGEFMGLHEALTSMFTIGVDIDMPVMGRITVIPTP